LADGSIGTLLWNSMATCAREGLGISNEDGAFTTTCESMGGEGGLVSWDVIVVDGGNG